LISVEIEVLIFDHPAQYLVPREYRQAIEDAEARLALQTQ
jgi:hypothetical protein